MDTNNNDNLEKTTVTSSEPETLDVTNEVKKEEVVATEENKTDAGVVEDKKEVISTSAQPEEKKEEPKESIPVSNASEVKPAKKQNKTILPLFLCIVGFICLGVGVFFALTTDSDDTTNDTNNTTNNSENNNNGDTNLGDNSNGNDSGNIELTVDNIKDYSTYNSFAIKATNKIVSTDINMEMITTGNFDAANKMIYAKSEMLGINYDIYYDLNNKMHYYSMDNVSWAKGPNEEMTFPDFTFIINKVKNNDNVTSLGEGVYLFDASASNLSFLTDVEGTIPVPITVAFDANGYLIRISYDLINTAEGATESSMVYEFSNVNTLDSVVVPENVLSSAVETPGTISLQF